MWSKQAETGNNKNMTSLKDKITHRKRKGNKSKNGGHSVEQNNANPTNKKVQQQGKNAARKSDAAALANKNGSKVAVVANGDKEVHVKSDNSDVLEIKFRAQKNFDDLIESRLSDSIKRYSDSFVVTRNVADADAKLSRAHSGFFVTDDESDFIKTDKNERKSRRFSDIFRYGALKTSNSCDDLKKDDTKMFVEDNGDLTEVALRKRTNDGENSANKIKKKQKGVVRTDSTVSNRDVGKGKIKLIQPVEKLDSNTNNSYLKRVKSKIYRPKSDNGAQPSMPQISENAKSKKNKNKKNEKTKDSLPELRGAASHADFRLIRQTSNLESVRPRTFGPKKSASNAGISELSDDVDGASLEIPVLAKSKSSSAINLSLLRTRRSKLLETMKRNCKIAQDEFDFIAFGGVQNKGVQLTRKFGSQNLISTINNNVSRPSSWLHGSSGDTKPGHPVARTGSDRRPDAVREESSKTQDGQNHTQENDDDTTNVDTSKSLPATTTHKRRNTSNINRSESVKEQSEKRKQRRNISDPLHNNKSDTTDIDQQNLNYITHSGSSSTASLSSRSSNDSPSFVDVSPFQGVSHSAGSGWGSDEDIEPDPPDWQSSLTEEELSRLQPHEKKRQDVINELFHTERSHLRNLKVLDRIFYRPLQELKILKQDEMSLLFPNLNRLLETHSQFNVLMKNKRKESVIVGDIGDILIVMFDGSLGETFKEAAATFCERQLLALDVIKEKRRKDSKFDNVLNECEKNIHCRRLPLQGFIPSEMQRLSKYPLLLERLIDIVEKNVGVDPAYSPAELCKLQQAHDRSKEILNHANEAAKQAWGRARLEEIYKHLDTSVFDKTASEHSVPNEFKTLDFKNCKLLHEGTVQLKRQNKGLLHVHMVLLEEVVILLQREGDRYLLKFFQTGMAGQQPLAPIIKVSTLLVRTNAALKSSLFLVNTSTQNSQMYELLTRDSTERKTWFKHLSDAADAYNKREGKSKRSEPTPDPDEETLQELPVAAREQGERAEAVGGGVSEPQPAEVEQSVHGSPDVSRPNSDAMDEDRDKRLSQSDNESGTPVAATSTTGGGVTTKFTADDWPLIQPSEVQVEVPPVHTAEPVLTPIEQIKRKGDEVRQALEDKEKLVADLLSIPRDEYHHIADMAIEESRSKEPCIEREPSELVLASVYQVDQLLKAVNDALSISETDPVLAKGGKHPSCASNDHISKNQMPSVPVHRLQEIATTLSSQLTTLLSVIKQKDEERDRIRKELQRTREQLHEKLSIHSPHYQDYDETTTQLDSTQSGDLESIEESPTENEST